MTRVERTIGPEYFTNPQVYDQYPDAGIALIGVETYEGPETHARSHFAIFAGEQFYTIMNTGETPDSFFVELDFHLYRGATPADVFYNYLEEEFGVWLERRDSPLIGH